MADLTVAGSNLVVPGVDPTTMKFESDDLVAALAADPRLNKGRGSSFGLLDITTWGAAPNQDNTAIFTEILEDPASAGRQWVLPGTDIYPGQIYARDKPITFYPGNTGFIGHMKGTDKYALHVDHRLGDEYPVNDIRGVYLDSADTGNPDTPHTEITVSRTALAVTNPQRGDAFWLYSNDYFKDATRDTVTGDGTGAADFNGEGLKTHIPNWATVLGIGIDVTDVLGSGGIRQGAVVVGVQSGATATVSSSVLSSDGPRVAILNNVRPGVGSGKGHFQAGENLTVDGVVKGSVGTRGAYIVTQKQLRFDMDMTKAVRIRKARTDVQLNLDGFRSVAVDDNFARADVDQFVGKANRSSAVRLTAVVDGRGTPYIESSWKHGVENAIGYRFRGGVDMRKGPAHAEDIESGWSYAWYDLGGAADNDLVCHGRHVRHVYSNGTRPKNGDLVEYDYIVTAGVAHDSHVHDGSGFDCLDAPFDTHPGSVGIVFTGNHAQGGGASGGRSQGRVAAFQMRGFGCIVKDNTIKGYVTGVRDVSSRFPAPFDMDAIYDSNLMYGINALGYDFRTGGVLGDESRGRTRIHVYSPLLYLSPDRRGNNMPANPNPATYIRMDVGWVEVIDPRFYGLRAGAPGYFGVANTTTTPSYVKISGGSVERPADSPDWSVLSTVPPATFQVSQQESGPVFIGLEPGQTPPDVIPANTYYLELEAQ